MSFPPVSFFFVLSSRLHDQSKHSALNGAEHFSCSFVVANVPAPYVSVGVTTASNRCNRCRSKYDWAISFLSMFGARGPRTSDPVRHLGGFLVHECHHLSQVLYFPFKKKYLKMYLTEFDFSQFVCFLACEDFCLAWVDFNTMRLRTSSATRMFEIQSLSHHSA